MWLWSRLPPLCLLPRDGLPARGRLSDDDRVEALLQGLLNFGPAAFLLLAAPVRIAQLRRAKLVVVPNRRGFVKSVAALVLFGTQAAGLAAAVQTRRGADTVAAQVLSVAAAAAVCVLSPLEHGRNAAPSALLTGYLALALLSDAVRAGLLLVAWNLCWPGSRWSSWAVVVAPAARLGLFLLEARTKRSILREPWARTLPPEDTAGYFGVAFFWWVNAVLRKGYATVFSLADMPPLGPSMDVVLVREAMLKEWDRRERPEGRYALLKAQLRCLWRAHASVVPPRLVFVVLSCSQPALVSRAITFVGADLPPLENRAEAFRLLVMALVIYAGMALANGMYQRRLVRLNCLGRMGLVGLLHRRCLTMRDSDADGSGAVTLANSDAEDVANSGELVHDLWSKTLELAVGMYLLAREVGWVCVLPLLVVIAVSRAVEKITDNVAERQMDFSQATQERVSLTRAVLDAVKTVRMMGAVDRIHAKIRDARDREMGAYVRFYRLMVAFFVSSVVLHLFSPAFTLIVYAVQAQIRGKQALDVETVFTALTIIDIVCTPANTLLGVIPEAASLLAALDRLQKYLLLPDREDKRLALDSGDASSDIAVRIDGATVRPAPTADPVLKNITASLPRGRLVVVSGAVGTGKTTLARALLGDVPPDEGEIRSSFTEEGRGVAYCAQTAWLPNGTIRDAICGPLLDEDGNGGVDEVWYRRVLHACDLEQDLDQMPLRDATVVGSRGTALSGGQKQRVALARAVYARPGLAILDDVLSALDATTEQHVFDNLLGLKGLFRELGTTVLLITHAIQHLPLADHIIVLDEHGSVAEQGSWEDLRARAGYISNVVLKEPPSGERSKKLQNGTDAADQDGDEDAKDEESPSSPETERMLDMARKTGDITLYSYYFRAVGPGQLFLLTFSLLVYSALAGLIPVWLRRLAESGGERMWFYTGVYFALTTATFLSVAIAVATIFLIIAPSAGTVLHTQLLDAVLRLAPQTYFSTTPTAATLSRFGPDMGMLDRSLPFALFQALQALFRVLTQAVLLVAVQPLLAAALPVAAAFVFVIQKLYLATSRQLRLLDLETRSLVSASFLETADGAATVRAFGPRWAAASAKQNAGAVDSALRPEYLLAGIQQWLDVVLDLMVPGLAVAVIGLAAAVKESTQPGQLAIALSVVLNANTYLLRLVSAWTRLETALGAISRLRAFRLSVAQNWEEGEEGGGETTYIPPEGWPIHGDVVFSRFSAAYVPETLALNDISVAIPAGARVGIVGRTGSGKTSLVLSLLRLIEPAIPPVPGAQEEGAVSIDGVDICRIPRETLRARLIVVPQDPMVLATDTVRESLAVVLPLPVSREDNKIVGDADVKRDKDMVEALQRVGLWSIMQARASSLPREEEGGEEENGKKDVLDITMGTLALSHGQQQLFALARAVLMRRVGGRGRLVLLDEATSSVDAATDKVMQSVVREEFAGYTVLTIAHRLDTVMGSDLVLVMDGGRLVEVGKPGDLAGKEGGRFRELLRGGVWEDGKR